MHVTKEQLEPCTVALSIEVDADQVRQAFGRAFRDFAPVTRVPGFRPGKAPRAMLERYVSPELLKERVANLLVGQAYRQALREEGILPYGEPELELSDLADGQPFSFKATVSLPPRVELGDYSSIAVERPVVTVTDSDVDKEIEHTRRELARLVPVTGRGIQEGDWVIGDLLIETEGQEAPTEPRRTLIRLGDNIPGFDEAILGMHPNDERTFTLTFPDDHQDEGLRGKAGRFTLKVGTIQQRVLPEVSDEWVREAIGLSSVAEWRAVLRERLQQSAQEVSQRVAMDRIVEQLVARSVLEYPASMVAEEVRDEIAEFREEISANRMTVEQYLQRNNLTEEQLRQGLEQRAINQLRARLVLAELAKKEQVQISEREIEEEFDTLLTDLDASDPAVKRLRKSDRRRRQVANRILRRKLQECLLRIASITDVEVKDDSEPVDQAEVRTPKRGRKEQ